MELKPALTFHDQICLLAKRGMIFDCEQTAEEYLSGHNYYYLNIYFHNFMDSKDHFIRETHFSHIIGICANDSWLRNKIMTILEPIEIKTRTQISNYLGTKYGSDAFYQYGIYKDKSLHQSNLDYFSKEVNHRYYDPVIQHHLKCYNQRFPIWVVVEYLSFSRLSKYYSNLLEMDKKIIAKQSYQINNYILERWLQALSVLRNICAHYGFLYHRKFTIHPKLEKSISRYLLVNEQLFSFFLAMKRLSNRGQWYEFISQIENREKDSTLFHLSDYGFPPDWRSYLI